jgi:hypothetical protein
VDVSVCLSLYVEGQGSIYVDTRFVDNFVAQLFQDITYLDVAEGTLSAPSFSAVLNSALHVTTSWDQKLVFIISGIKVHWKKKIG